MTMTSIWMGVEKFITGPEEKGSPPFHSMVALDINNIFNAI